MCLQILAKSLLFSSCSETICQHLCWCQISCKTLGLAYKWVQFGSWTYTSPFHRFQKLKHCDWGCYCGDNWPWIPLRPSESSRKCQKLPLWQVSCHVLSHSKKLKAYSPSSRNHASRLVQETAQRITDQAPTHRENTQSLKKERFPWKVNCLCFESENKQSWKGRCCENEAKEDDRYQ